MHRLKAALNTRASRNRDGFGDPRYDGEVALRTEIEALRAKTREQTAHIARLQSLVARAGPAAEGGDTASARGSGDAMRPPKVRAGQVAAAEQAGPPPLNGFDRASETPDPQAQNEIRRLKSVNQDQAGELSRIRAALATYEAADSDDRGVKESKIALKARLSALKALTDEQTGTIQALRTELAAGNEKLARQAAYFMEEMRRLGSVPAAGPSRRGADAAEAAKRPPRRAHQRSARGALPASGRGRPNTRGGRRKPRRGGAASQRRFPEGAGRGVSAGRDSRRACAGAGRCEERRRCGDRGQAHAQGAAARPHHGSRQELSLNFLRSRRRLPSGEPAAGAREGLADRVAMGFDVEHRLPIACILGAAHTAIDCAPSAMIRFFCTMSPLMRAVLCSATVSARSWPLMAPWTVRLRALTEPVTLPVSPTVTSSPWMSPVTSPAMTSAVLQTSVIFWPTIARSAPDDRGLLGRRHHRR
ncbi:MAG: hypothetical protein WDN31_09700 [Hyphomicrobium sp.]